MLDPSSLKRMAQVTAVITEMAAVVVLGTVAGYWLDARLGTSPLLLMGLSMAGLIFGMILLTRNLNRLNDPPDDSDE